MEDENNGAFSAVSTSTSSTSSTESLIDYSYYIVEPHKINSRDVTEADLPRVIEDSHIMYQICYAKCGLYMGAIAVAHPQITKDDPLRFFVTYDQRIIINPVIVNHTQVTVDSREGCVSFMTNPEKVVPRYNKITVEYQTLNPDGTLSEKITAGFNGRDSKMFQHETDHLDSKYIYEI